LNVNINDHPFFFIPLNGCRECVELALDYLDNNKDNNKFIYIINSYNKRDFSLILKENYESSMVLYDTFNYAGIKSLVLNTPIVYYIKNDSLKTVLLQNEKDYLTISNL